MILASEEEQGAVVASESVKHFPHDDGMVAAFVTLHDLAFEIADSAVQHCGAVSAFVPIQAGELVRALGGEAARDLFLIFVKKINRKYIRLNEARITLGSLIDANQDERRIERQRRKGVGGETKRRACGVFRRDNGYAGRKMTEYSAQLL